MPQDETLESFAVKTYRYLRLSIVVVVASALVSVVIERLHTTCWEGSISAYYFTPARNVFVGALVVIGVSLIAIKGSTDREDVLLNLAGVLAPIVAFVPTSRPEDSCSSIGVIAENTKPFIDNNVPSFAFGGLAALLIALWIASRKGRPTMGDVRPQSRFGLAAGFAIFAFGLAWYLIERRNFLDHAHITSAIAMFVVVGVVIALNARDRWAAGKSFWLYALLAGAMAASVLVVGFLKLVVDEDWGHWVFWLELLELSLFAGYWVVQTSEHWDGGVPTGAQRVPRGPKPALAPADAQGPR